MNKTGIAAGLALIVGGLALGGAWYTGGQLGEVLQASVARGDRQLQDAMPGLPAGLELLDVQRGLLRSQARYALTLGRPDRGGQRLVIVDQIEHGPLPWSRLKSLKLWPVMAVSHFQLEEDDALRSWFAANGGRSPLAGRSSIGYDGTLAGELQVLALKTLVDGHGLDVGELNAEFEGGAEGVIKLAARLERLNLDLIGEHPARVELAGITLLSDRRLGASGLYLGDSRLALQHAELVLPGKPTLELSELVQTDRLQEQDGQVFGQFTYTLEQIRVEGRPLGSARMDWSMQKLDAQALKVLGELYREYALKGRAGRAAELDASQRARLESAMAQLLAGQPRLALNELSLRTANGEGRLSLGLTLTQPDTFSAPFEELLNQVIAALDAKVQVAKPLLSDLILFQAALQPGADLEATAVQARAAVEMGGEILSATRLGRIEGPNIVSEISYANGQVLLNGQTLPVEQFLGLLLALGQMTQAGDVPQAGVPPLPESQ